MRVADVEFYFYMQFGEHRHPLAMVTLFSMPDTDVLSDSSNTVYLSLRLQSFVVIPITTIRAVVSMFPELKVDQTGEITETGKFSLMRHVHLELAKYPSQGQATESDDGSV
jgi:hypothetical protein